MGFHDSDITVHSDNTRVIGALLNGRSLQPCHNDCLSQITSTSYSSFLSLFANIHPSSENLADPVSLGHIENYLGSPKLLLPNSTALIGIPFQSLMAHHAHPHPHASPTFPTLLSPQIPLHLHVITANNLTGWLTPLGVAHMKHPHGILPWLSYHYVCILSLNQLPHLPYQLLKQPDLVFPVSAMTTISPESLHMPASGALLMLFITFCGTAFGISIDNCHWLLGLELWHEINGTPCWPLYPEMSQKVIHTLLPFAHASADTYDGCCLHSLALATW